MMSEEKTEANWHEIPRKEINWCPTIEPELRIECGICILGCGPGVYTFDYRNNIPVVTYPFRCKVGCTVCAAHAIGFRL